MVNYIKWIFAALLLVAIAAQDVYWYNKGKDSGFGSVLAGVSTSQKKEELAVSASVAQSSEDATKIANLERDKNDLRKQLQANLAKHPLPPVCRIDSDSLLQLQAVSAATKPGA